MSDYFERLEGQLLDAVERHAKRPTRRRPVRLAARRGLRVTPDLGSVVVILTTVVTVLVGGAALLLIRHRTPTPALGTAAQLPTGADPLAAELAVLRRPQARADRAPVGHPSWVVILAASTRLAATLPNGQRLFLYIGTVDPSQAPERLRARLRRQQRTGAAGFAGYSLGTYLAGSDGSRGPSPGITASAIRRIRGPWWGQRTGRATTFTAIVPDGVARVRWVFTRHSRPPISVDVIVKSNVATVNVNTTPGDVATQTTWYTAAGNVIATTRGTSAP